MKTLPALALAAATCMAALAYGQSAATAGLGHRGGGSIYDRPGTLGHQYSDLSFGWTDFRHSPAEGYEAGLKANVPLADGFDAGLGYTYYWEGRNRDPLTRADSNARNHTLDATGRFYLPMSGVKPFLGGGVGYRWERGDLQRLRTYGHEWLWSASAGVEIPFGRFAVTPMISYDDTMRGGSVGAWSYGGEVHHWFNEKVGAYVDASYHDPNRGGNGMWTYLGGMRFRF